MNSIHHRETPCQGDLSNGKAQQATATTVSEYPPNNFQLLVRHRRFARVSLKGFEKNDKRLHGRRWKGWQTFTVACFYENFTKSEQ